MSECRKMRSAVTAGWRPRISRTSRTSASICAAENGSEPSPLLTSSMPIDRWFQPTACVAASDSGTPISIRRRGR